MKRGEPIIFLALCCLLSAGCNKRPEGVLSEKETIELLTDLEMAQAYFSTSPPGHGITKDALTKSVLEKHGVSQEELDSTISYYGRNIDEYYLLYQKIEKNLQTKNGRLEGNKAGDDIWPYNRFAAFMRGQLADGLTFSFPADDLEPGSTLDWAMRLTNAEGIEMTLGVEYENGISSIVKKNTAGNTSVHLNLITDTTFSAKRIFGHLSVPTHTLPLWADSIRLIRTEFDSLEYQKFNSQKRIFPPSERASISISIDSLQTLSTTRD